VTVKELTKHINDTIGYQVPMPETLEVDHETYANVCWYVVNYVMGDDRDGRVLYPPISFGPHGGIFFKNTELILKGASIETSI